MKKFLAIYVGTPAAFERWKVLDEAERKKRERAGMDAWMRWGQQHEKAIVDGGTPLGKTKRADASGVSDTKNIAGYVIIQAASHEAAAKMFANHPHFSIFPGEAVEIMECLPMPKM